MTNRESKREREKWGLGERKRERESESRVTWVVWHQPQPAGSSVVVFMMLIVVALTLPCSAGLWRPVVRARQADSHCSGSAGCRPVGFWDCLWTVGRFSIIYDVIHSNAFWAFSSNVEHVLFFCFDGQCHYKNAWSSCFLYSQFFKVLDWIVLEID